MEQYFPCLLEKAPEPFDSDEFQFDVKWDGFRALAYVTRQGTRVMSRWGTDLTPAFPELGDLWPMFRKPTVIDGELVVLDDNGLAQFDLLQKRFRSRRADIPVTLVAFDVLHHGRSVVDRTLAHRQTLLESLVSATDPLVMRSIPIVGDGRALYEHLGQKGLHALVHGTGPLPEA